MNYFIKVTIRTAIYGILVAMAVYVVSKSGREIDSDCYQAKQVIKAYEACRDDSACFTSMQDRVDYDQALDVMEFTQCQ